ncbi:MAG: SurA N-terminal domain-containing protein [bacterium]|nr:SurA N-terminal domain-containing protein [bacterium]
MAAAKRKTPRSTTSVPRIRKIRKFSFNFSDLRNKTKSEYNSHASLYPLVIFIIIVLIVLAALFTFRRGLFLAGTVNGQFVSTPEFYQKLVQGGGTSTFDTLTRDILIKQEAAKKKLTVSQKEVDSRLTTVEKNLGGKDNLNNALSQNNLTLAELKKQLEVQLLAEKILDKDLQVSDAEVTKYIAENKDATKNMSRDEVKEQLRTEKFNTKFTSWYDELKKNAKIVKYF